MFQNLGVKLVCLLVALVLWAQVASNSEVMREIALPLQVSGLPDSLVVVRSLLPETVDVRVRGSRLQLLGSDVFGHELGRVRLELDRETVGTRRVRLAANQVEGEVTALDIVSPVLVELSVQRRLQRAVPVRLRLEGTPADDVALSGRPVVEPTSVTAEGPEELVLALEEVPTEVVRLDRRRSSFVQRVALVPPHPDVTLRPVEVSLEVGIEPVVERVIDDVLVTIYGDGVENFERLRLDPSMVRVRLFGAAGVVDRLGPEDVEALVLIDRGVSGVDELPVEIVGIDGVQRWVVEPRSIQVVVDAPDTTAGSAADDGDGTP